MSDPIKQFIQATLGCTCPEAVFRRIDSRADVAVGGITLSRRIDVGHRLLVYVMECDDPDDLVTRLPTLVSHGRDARDRDGYNRLRIVVATDYRVPVTPAAQQAFERAKAGDERLHLHVVDKAALAQL